MSIVAEGAPRRSRVFPEQFLERLYAMPRETATWEDFERRRHGDLPAMSDPELAREFRRVQRRADYESDVAALAWLEGRLDAIRLEQGRRNHGQEDQVRRPIGSGQRAGGRQPSCAADEWPSWPAVTRPPLVIRGERESER